MKKALIAVVAGALLSGCLTVGLDNTFTETVETYRADGTLESVTTTEWSQDAKGGPFTDVQKLKQDTFYRIGADDTLEIGQGSGAEGVRGSGQVDALSQAITALSASLGVLRAFVPAP